MLKNDPKMSPILVHKTSKKEQKRLPKWDPLKKTPKGGQMEPKWLQNKLKMEQKLIENVTKMLPKWCPLSFKIVRDRTSFACVFFVVFSVFVWSSPSFPLSLSAVVVVVVVVVVLVSLLLHSLLLLFLFLFPLSLSRFCACLLFLVLSCCFAFCSSLSPFSESGSSTV